MLPRREGGEIAWAANDMEREEISYWLRERLDYPPDERAISVLVPPAADASIEGAFRWSMGVSWQDQPVWTAVGSVCAILSVVNIVLKAC